MGNSPHVLLDEVDHAIVETLAADARVSNAALADQVGIAQSTCLSRVTRLRERGVLRGFHAEIDLAALGRPILAVVAVRLAAHDRKEIETFTASLHTLQGVLMVFHVTGQIDYLVWVAAADTQDLRRLVIDHLVTHPAVAHAETSLVYEHTRGPGIFGDLDPV